MGYASGSNITPYKCHTIMAKVASMADRKSGGEGVTGVQTCALPILGLNRHLAIIPSPIHGIRIGIEYHSVQVPYDNGQGGKYGRIPVNSDGDIDTPAWHAIAHTDLEPYHHPGVGHHEHAPH